MKRLLLLLALLVMYTQQAAAQNTSLGISAFYWNGPQNVSYGDTSYFTYAVKNYGPNAINVPITIYTGVWDSLMNGIDTIDVDSSTLAQTVLGPGDSVWVNDMQVYDSINFRIGATVVVIWPAASNAVVQNTASYTIFVESSMSTIEVAQREKPGVYPNPASDKITISPPGGDLESTVEQVRLYDAAGKLLLSRKDAGALDISMLPSGSYLVEIIQSDNTRYVYRIIRQER